MAREIAERKTRNPEAIVGRGAGGALYPLPQSLLVFSSRFNLVALSIASALGHFARPLDYPERDC